MISIFKRVYSSIFNTFERKDLSQWEREPAANLPVYGVYHAFLDTGWEDIVEAQIDSLKRAGLLDYTRKLYISCIARDSEDVEKLLQKIGNHKAEIISTTSDFAQFEYPALRYIKALSEREECLIYYFHTKGITYQSANTGNNRAFRSFVSKIKAWNEMMEYFIFDKWSVAVNALSAGYDTYGCYRWPPRKYTMYSGSFWWSTSSYIKTLPDFCSEVITKDRFYSEIWLYEHSPNDFSAFDTIADLYFVRLPRSIYSEKKPRMTDVIRFIFMYNYRKTLKHLFGYNYKKRNQQRFQKIKK